MTLRDVLSDAHAVALGWALLHSLWQLALVAGLLASVNVLLGRRSAHARYAAATAALLAMIVLPAVTFVLARDAGAASASVRRPEVRAAAFVAEEGESSEPEVAAVEAPAALAVSAPVRRTNATPARPLAALRLRERLDAVLPILVLAWAAGVVALSLRVLGGWAMAQRLRRSGRPVAIEAWTETAVWLCRRMRVWLPVRLCESALVEVPTVIGWLRPVVLLPASTLVGLSPSQLEALLAHELAHIRRFDYLVNLVQAFGETLLFYHPAVWWVSHRMRVEREHCCDDAAVAVCGDPMGYARALAELEGLRAAAPTVAMAASGGALWARVARIVGAPTPHLPSSARWAAGLLALLTVGALGLSAGASLEGGTPAGLLEGPGAVRMKPADYGVTREFVCRLADLGYDGLSENKLIALRTNGVTPSYVEGLQDAGYKELSVSRLILLRTHGITPEYAESLKDLGYDELPPLRLVALRTNGVTPEYVEGMKDLGYGDLSVSMLIGLRSHGVDPDFVEGLKEEGLEDLEVGELLALRQHGVTGTYLGRLKAAGYEDLDAEKVIELRSSGVDPSPAPRRAEQPCGDKKRHSEEEEP